MDGQLEADPDGVASALHPDLAKRAVIGDTPYERLGLRACRRKGRRVEDAEAQWSRICRVLDVVGDADSAGLETPWFIDYFRMGRFDGKWIIVNALWYSKPR